jgi:hypothetical protein
MITNSGTCDIMFRSKADLEAYRAFDTNLKPFLISRIYGHATLVESKPNEVVFREQLDPFRLLLYNLSFTSEDTVRSLLRDNTITISGYEVLVNGARQTHRIGFFDDSERLRTTLLLGGKRLPGLNNNQPIQLSLDVGCPARRCFHCYHPDHPLFSVGHLSRDYPNTHKLCLVCHLLDHLTFACPWVEAQVTLNLPPPRSTIPVELRLYQPLEPARAERRRSSKCHREHYVPSRERKPTSNSGWSSAGHAHGRNGGSNHNGSDRVSRKQN